MSTRGTEIQKFVQNWYSLMGRELPVLGTKKFSSFITGTSGIYLEVIKDGKVRFSKPHNPRIQIRFAEAPAASFNSVKSEIVLPFWYTSEAALETFKLEGLSTSALSITLLNGSLVHESLHAVHSDEDIDLLAREVLPVFSPALAQAWAQFFNVVEDIYIESLSPKIYEQVLINKNDVLFSEDTCRKAFEKWNEEQTIESFLGAFVTFKRKALQGNSGWESLRDFYRERVGRVALTSAVKSCVEAFFNLKFEKLSRAIKIRAFVAYALMTCFCGREVEEFANKFAPEPILSYDGEPSSEAEAKAAEVEKEECDTEIRTAAMVSAAEATEEIKKSEYVIVDGKVSEIPCVQEFEVEDLPSHVKNFSRCPQLNTAFVQQLRYLRTRNHAPSVAQKRGATLQKTRLSRIITDGKIFASRDEIQTPARIEVIEIVDASGSTGTYIKPGVSAVRLFDEMVNVAIDTYEALREIQIACSVYAHSGSVYPILAHVVSGSMNKPAKSEKRAFEALAAFDLRENFDGIVYEEVAKKFTNLADTRILIILSDGVPSAGMQYAGKFAFEHTKGVVDQLRERGIVVICMACGNSYEQNASLYGERYTMDCSTDISSKFKMVLEEIASK